MIPEKEPINPFTSTNIATLIHDINKQGQYIGPLGHEVYQEICGKETFADIILRGD